MVDTAVSVQVSRGSFVSNNIHLVPDFCESSVHSFFSVFERLATALQWPQDVWGVMLLCRLTGKAQEACSGLSRQDGLVYGKVKRAVLKAYELVPEAYRQHFRRLELAQGQSYLDFAREKARLFDRWCAASQVNDVGSVRELMLVEDFKNSVPKSVALYLSEQRVTTLQQAATLADEFRLTHKASAVGQDIPLHYSASWTGESGPAKKENAVMVLRPRPKLCFFCHKPGHVVANCVKLALKQKAHSTQKGPVLRKVSRGSQTDKLARPTERLNLEHNCSVAPRNQCTRPTNPELPLVDPFSGSCSKPPFRSAPLANKYVCVSAKPASCLLGSPHVIVRSPGYPMGHCFEGLGPLSGNVVNPLRWDWQFPQAMPNRCYGVW